MKRLIENQVDEAELEELYGGSGSGSCDCRNKFFSDEEDEENIVF